MKSKRKFSADFKAKVAIEAIKEQSTLQDLATKYELHIRQISHWKRQFLENAGLIFEGNRTENKEQVNTRELFEQIGQLKVENDFLKKKLY